MRQQAIILICTGIVFCLVNGCGQKNEKMSAEPQKLWDGTTPAQEAMPDFFADAPATNAFPESVVGQWEAETLNFKWVINFEPDGSIKKIYHTFAEDVNIEEGGVDANGLEGSYWTFVMGPCEARYVPDTKTIKVKIIVDYYMIKVPGREMEGRIEDYFEGPISQDGTMWNTQWRNFRWMKNTPLPPIDAILAEPEPLIFVKIDPNNPPEEAPLR